MGRSLNQEILSSNLPDTGTDTGTFFNIFSEGPRFDPGLWFFDSWINIKYYFYCTFFIKCVVAQLVDDWFHKSDVMSSNLPDTIKNVFF